MVSSDLDDADADAAGAALADTVLCSYIAALGPAAHDDEDLVHKEGGDYSTGLDRVREALAASGSDGVCMICLERLSPHDAVWTCGGDDDDDDEEKEVGEVEAAGCFYMMHLQCIQSWARQSLAVAATAHAPALERGLFPGAAAEAEVSARWSCPSCRKERRREKLPSQYRCFCGKERDPPFNPWVAPHSCGEVCGRRLKHSGVCSHRCLLQCHPGPHLPCPVTVKATCFCGAAERTVRCHKQAFSCSEPCGQKLPCGHPCRSPCHPPGQCPACELEDVHACRCGKTKERRACAERDFACANVCGLSLGCEAHHACQRECHSDPCGPCPGEGRFSCHCGKTPFKLSCGDPTPRCSNACDKRMPCGHACQERCGHSGPCEDNVCMVMTAKIVCACGSLEKSMPCHQRPLVCERRCKKTRACGQHKCSRRCCDGTSCPPCEEVCGKRLRCGNHSCPAPCHSGPCRLCLRTIPVECWRHGEVSRAPCGSERTTAPPRCRAVCEVKPPCGHVDVAPHRCHFGAHPACKAPCGAGLGCGHTCDRPCHGPRAAPCPPFVLPMSKKEAAAAKANHEAALRRGPSGGTAPCPPCPTPVKRRCVGGHEARDVPCSSPPAFACAGKCARLLACTRHACDLPCHGVENIVGGEAGGGDGGGADDAGLWRECEECDLPCQLPRPSGCGHLCAAGGCHEGSCEPCLERRRERCHCGSRGDISVSCSEFSEAPEGSAARAKLLSCGAVCSVKFKDCPHSCQALCHPGECPDPSSPLSDTQQKKRGCAKRVTVRCPCNRRSERVACWVVRAAAAEAGTEPGSEAARAFAAWAAGGNKPCGGDQQPPPVLECTSECSSKTTTATATAELMAADVKPVKGDGAEVTFDPVERRRMQKERKKEEQERRRVAAGEAAAAKKRISLDLDTVCKVLAKPETIGALVFLTLAILFALFAA